MARKLDEDAKVIALVAQGMTTKEIAQVLGVGDATIRKRIASIFDRLGVKSRAAMVAKSIASGVIVVRDVSRVCNRKEDKKMHWKERGMSAKITRTHIISCGSACCRVQTSSAYPLTQLATLVAEGLTNDQIAEETCYSTATIKYWLAQAFVLLDARDRAAFVAHAYGLGIISGGTWPPEAAACRQEPTLKFQTVPVDKPFDLEVSSE